MMRFIDKRFRPCLDLTIGIEYGQSQLIVKDKCINLQIYDTAGQENFRSIVRGKPARGPDTHTSDAGSQESHTPLSDHMQRIIEGRRADYLCLI